MCEARCIVRDVLYATYIIRTFSIYVVQLHTRQWHQVERVIVEKLIDDIFRDISLIFRR